MKNMNPLLWTAGGKPTVRMKTNTCRRGNG